jgi:hypothetical protein
MNNNDLIENTFFYWGPYLWKTKVTQHIVDELLIRAKKTNNKHNEFLAGQIDKEYKYNEDDIVWFTQIINPYLNIYINEGDYWYKKYIKNRKFNLKLESLWINFMKNGEFNPEHIHDSDLSFVIYLQVPEILKQERKQYVGRSGGPGSIEFLYGEDLNFFITSHTFFPENKDIFIFPGKLRHMVCPFKSNCERISVSGNLNFDFL